MSNATEEELDNLSDEELEQRALAEAEGKQAKAAPVEPEPQPEPVETPSQAPEPEEIKPPVTPSQSPEPVIDRQQSNDNDPLERARKKGLNSPEALARAYAQMEDEFHRRNQAGHPGYRDIGNGNPSPQPTVPPAWTPNPQVPPNYYQPPMPPPQPDVRRLAQQFDMDPEDFDKIARLNAALTQHALRQERARWEVEMSGIRRQTERNAEFAQLMQDPAFVDRRVQDEMKEILKDGSLFQQGGRAFTRAFEQALANLARKQLQQEMPKGNTSTVNNPPVTAGGGNGSANTAPYSVTEKDFLGWTEEQQKAFLESNGKRIPRR